MNAGAWVLVAMFVIGTVLIGHVGVLCARDSRRASGKAPLYRRLRARLTGRRVRIHRDGRPLTNVEMGDWIDALRGFARKPDAELARFEAHLEELMREGS